MPGNFLSFIKVPRTFRGSKEGWWDFLRDLQWEKKASSLNEENLLVFLVVAPGNLGSLFLSFNGNLRDRLQHQETPVSIRVVRPLSGIPLHSSAGPYPVWLRSEPSDFLSSADIELGVSEVSIGNLTCLLCRQKSFFLSSCTVVQAS